MPTPDEVEKITDRSALYNKQTRNTTNLETTLMMSLLIYLKKVRMYLDIVSK